jgi:MSHA pilin protein MshD
MSTRSARGFTLMELILLIVVISIALAGILLMYSTSLRGSADPLAWKQALAVAEAMLEEVQLNAFCNPSGGFSGAATQANRQNFDDVSDYNGYNTASEATPGIYTIDGTVGSPIAGLEFYNVSVTVATSALGAVPAADSKLITVTVTGPTNLPNSATIVLAGYRTDYTGTCP